MQRARSVAVALLAIGTLAAVLGLLVRELDTRERDRHAVQALVSEIARKIRAHDGTLWHLVERSYPPGEQHPALEPHHHQLVADLDRLAHMRELRLIVRDIRVEESAATVDYVVEGKLLREDERPAPRAGRFTFERRADGWALGSNRFSGAPLDGK
jgi:hypothetical protein